MSQVELHRLYLCVLRDVIDGTRKEFISQGMEAPIIEEKLNKLSQVWRTKLDAFSSLPVSINQDPEVKVADNPATSSFSSLSSSSASSSNAKARKASGDLPSVGLPGALHQGYHHIDAIPVQMRGYVGDAVSVMIKPSALPQHDGPGDDEPPLKRAKSHHTSSSSSSSRQSEKKNNGMPSTLAYKSFCCCLFLDLFGDSGDEAKADDDALGSEDEVEDDTEPATQNLVLCQYESVKKHKGKWKTKFRDGIIRIADREYAFSRASGDFTFT